MEQERRLHVWEHPDLHRSDPTPPLGNLPVHLIYEPHEYDWWMVDGIGDLRIGHWIKVDSPEPEGGYRMEPFTQVVIPRGMYAKAIEETVTHTPPPDEPDEPDVPPPMPPTMPDAPAEPPAVAPYDADATVTLPRVSMPAADATAEFGKIADWTLPSIGTTADEGANPSEPMIPMRFPLP